MKCIIRSILLFVGVLLFFSCQSQRDITGKYVVIQRGKYPKIIPVTFYIELNSDSTFIYNFRSGFHGEVSTGFWKTDKDNKRIIINSFIQDIRNIPVVVTEMKSNNNSCPLFVFDNPLKLDTSIKWALNINDMNYPLSTDSLVLGKGIVVENIYLTGHIALTDNTDIIPIPLQDTIQSKKYNVKDSNNNVYHIAFPIFFNYDIFHYKPLQVSLKLNRRTLLFEEIKLKKK